MGSTLFRNILVTAGVLVNEFTVAIGLNKFMAASASNGLRTLLALRLGPFFFERICVLVTHEAPLSGG
jgi:hypothetical protein